LAGYSYGHRDRRFAAQDGERSIGNATNHERAYLHLCRCRARRCAGAHNPVARTLWTHLGAAFLAPDIVETILDGRQHRDLSVLELRNPIADWDQQRRLLGFSPVPA
jgi:hypothetical protein